MDFVSAKNIAMCLLLGMVCHGSAGSVTVEIQDLPDGYSLRYSSLEPILKSLPALRPRVYRKLRFPDQADELAFSLKTGNAPDVLSLSWLQYRRLAEEGHLLDLSGYLLREPDIANSGLIEAGWTPLREAGPELLSQMLVDGRIYGFPSAKSVHGMIVRRDLLEAGDPVDFLTAPQAARLALVLAQRMNGSGQGRGIAVPLDAELFMYWAIADYGYSIRDRNASELLDSDKRAAALAALQGVYGVFLSMLHSPVSNCSDCNAPSFVFQKESVQLDGCKDCLDGKPRRDPVFSPAGRVVASSAEGLRLFRIGKVASVVCTRSCMVDLVEAGMTPGEIRFIPLAGNASIPDVRIQALYSGVPSRNNGEEREKILVEFLKLYSSQFLVGMNSPLYLWYERNLVSEMVRQGYRSLYSDSEIAVCQDIARACGQGSGSDVSDSMTQYENIVSLQSFAGIAGIDLSKEIAPIIAAAVSGEAGRGDFLTELDRIRNLELSDSAGQFILVLFLAGMLASGIALLMVTRERRCFRACLPGCMPVQLFFVILLVLLVILKVALPLAWTSLSLSSVIIDGRNAGYIAHNFLKDAGSAVLDILISIFLGCSIALLVSRLVLHLKRWGVITGFIISIPLVLAGFWGYLLLDSVVDWFADPVLKGVYVVDPLMSSVLRAVPAAWALLPVFVSGYVYRLRRINALLYDVIEMEGARLTDRFFLVTIPALEPVIKLHALSLGCISLLSSITSVMGADDGGAGGGLLRSIIFDSDTAATLTRSGLVFMAVTLFVWLGQRWIRAIKVVPVYKRSL